MKLMEYITMVEIPKIILSDMGKEFNNSLVGRIENQIGMEHQVTSDYSPRMNGENDERMYERRTQGIGVKNEDG